jgi:hypothetical protein
MQTPPGASRRARMSAAASRCRPWNGVTPRRSETITSARSGSSISVERARITSTRPATPFSAASACAAYTEASGSTRNTRRAPSVAAWIPSTPGPAPTSATTMPGRTVSRSEAK